MTNTFTLFNRFDDKKSQNISLFPEERLYVGRVSIAKKPKHYPVSLRTFFKNSLSSGKMIFYFLRLR